MRISMSLDSSFTLTLRFLHSAQPKRDFRWNRRGILLSYRYMADEVTRLGDHEIEQKPQRCLLFLDRRALRKHVAC